MLGAESLEGFWHWPLFQMGLYYFFFLIKKNLLIVACHWYLVLHFPVILVIFIACLNSRL